MTDQRGAEREGLFYGWYVVGALFFATFMVVGTRQGFGVFVARLFLRALARGVGGVSGFGRADLGGDGFSRSAAQGWGTT